MNARSRLVTLFFAPYAALGILVGVLDVSFRIQLSRWPHGVAAYITPYDVSSPTASLINDQIGGRIETFDRRDSVILIGNSIIGGAGAVQRLHLDTELAGGLNVINVGLPGEQLSSSVALAAYGADRAARRNPQAVLHIVTAYPVSRFYFWSAYGVFAEPIARLCASEPQLRDALIGCGDLLRRFPRPEVHAEVRNLIIRGAPCQVSPTLVLAWAKDLRLNCQSFLDQVSDKPEFMQQYRSESDKFGDPSAVRDFFLKQTGWVESAAGRSDAVTHLGENLGRLKTFLNSRGVRHTFDLMILSEAPGALRLLPDDRQAAYQSGVRGLGDELRRAHPEWRVTVVPPFDDADYYDVAHLKESGQSKLAAVILGLFK